ncbi:MAG: NADH-quinone oxidoreductase subunit NuoF [Spirochaetota bacterium]
MLRSEKDFLDLRKQAQKEWENLTTSDKPLIMVGTATCGRSAGALEVLDAINETLHASGIRHTIFEVGCIGLCYAEPTVIIKKPYTPGICYGHITPHIARKLVTDYVMGENPLSEYALGTIGNEGIDGIEPLESTPVLRKQVRRVMKNCGIIDPENIMHYIAKDGYCGLLKALKMEPGEIIEEVKRSGLRGRGGAGFPTGVKWEVCRNAPGDEKYIICNIDEGDPGAFMDRSVVESDPHAAIEGMLIGALAIGAIHGFIYLRNEYPLALKRMYHAIAEAERYGLLGKNILGSGFNFNLSIHRGAGAFVCGEETSLINSIEGKLPFPRVRPPFPAQSGYRGKPTCINNVETWANVPQILNRGSEWFASVGTSRSRGTKVFSLAGKVNHTGLVEVPMGITLRDIVFDIGGGIKGGKLFKAVQMGGPSGGCIPAEKLDTIIDYDSVVQTGAIMGSGGMVVIDEGTCMVEVARYFLAFTQDESCGKCTFCRIGTKRMLEILERITTGEGNKSDPETLERLAVNIKKGSLCGLGQTAPNPVLTTLRYFRHEYDAHIKEKRCPAKQCRNLITFTIIPKKCTGCGVCLKKCPAHAISGKRKEVHVIDQNTCIKCGICFDSCRFEAIEVT